LREAIEIQVKASKKEKARYNVFLAQEEKRYSTPLLTPFPRFWGVFPRNKKFYNRRLLQIEQLYEQFLKEK